MEMIKTEQYREAAAYLASRIEGNPETAIILGSGLGSLADQIIDPIVIPYVEIPHFMKSTATGFMVRHGDLPILRALFGIGKGSGAALMLFILGVTGSLICIIVGGRLKKYHYNEM